MQTNILKDLVHISTEMGKLAEEVESDLVTQDIIVSEKQVIDKKAWMLRAMLGK
jgi:DNA-binding ferritin-like protein